jgi:hypothetical protein
VALRIAELKELKEKMGITAIQGTRSIGRWVGDRSRRIINTAELT